MATPTRGALRWWRSAALATATVGLAATAHVLGDGDIPSVAPLAVLTLLTSLVCVIVTGRQRGPVFITVTMATLQAVLHGGFMLLGGSPMGAYACGLSTHAQHVAGALGQCAAAQAGHLHQHLGASPGMLLAHAVATVLLASALAGGERALWALRRLVAPLPSAPVPPMTVEAAAPVPVGAPVVLTAWTSVRDLVRRGPPVALSVVHV